MKSQAIYVADKNPNLRNLIRYNLEKSGYREVQAFSSPDECLYRMQKGPSPDFIITCFQYRDQNGFDFLRRLKALAPGTQVVFFDDFDDSLLPGQLIEAGAQDYVVKTGNPDAGINDLIKNIGFLVRAGSLS